MSLYFKDKRSLTAAVVLLLGLASGLAPAAVPPLLSHEEMGVDVTTYFNGVGRFTITMANDITNLGVRWIRNNFRRSNIADIIEYDKYDTIITRAQQRGLHVLGLIGTDSKQWSSTMDWQNVTWQLAFSNRVMEIVSRYQDRILFWEIWNEPNSMSGVPSATYGQIIAMCYRAIKTRYPHLTVLHAGLSWAWNDARNYLSNVYGSAACQAYRAAYGHYPFDIVAIHPYAWTSNPDTYFVTQINGFKVAMNARGDGWKRIWITEMGWSNTDSSLGLNKGSQTANDYYQALYLTKAYRIISTLTDPAYPQYGPYVEKMFWFAYEDNPFEDAALGLRAFSGFTVTTLGATKPCYYAYQDIARHTMENVALVANQRTGDSMTPPANTVTQACDDSPVTLWLSTNAPGDHELILDCGASMTVREHTLLQAGCAGMSTNFNTAAFSIATGPSMAGPWSTHYTVTNPARAPVTILTTAPPVDARCARLLISSPNNGTDNVARIAEWKLFATPLVDPIAPLLQDDFNVTWVNNVLWQRNPPAGYVEPQFYLLFETNGTLHLRATNAWAGPSVSSFASFSNVVIMARVTITDPRKLPGGNDEAHAGLAFNCNDGHEYHLNFFAHDGVPDTPNIRLRRSGDWATVGDCRTNVPINAGASFGMRITTGVPAPDSLMVDVGQWPLSDGLLHWSGHDDWSSNGYIMLENWQLGECTWDFVAVTPFVPEPVAGGLGVLLLLLRRARSPR